MLTKIKNLSEIKLNKEDVLFETLVKIKTESGIIMPDDMKEASKKDFEDVIRTNIIAVGENVPHLKVGDIIDLKSGVNYTYEIKDQPDPSIEWRISIIHMNNVQYGVDPSNYEL